MHRRVFSICYLLQYCAIGLFVPYMGVYFHNAGITGVQLGWLLGVMPLARIVAQPLWSFFGDLRQAHKFLLVLASLASAILGAALYLTGVYIWFFILVVLFSFMHAAVDPYLISMTLNHLKKNSKEEDFGLIRLWGSIGFSITSLLVGVFLLDELLHLLPLIYGLIMVLFASFAMFLPTGMGSMKSPSWVEGVRILPERPGLVRFFIGCLFVGATIGISMQYQTIYLEILGAPGWMIGVALSLQAIIEVPLMIAAPTVMRRFGVEKVLLVGVMALPLRWFLFSIIKNPVWILPVQILHSVAIVTLMVVGMVFVSRQIPDQWKATGLGMYTNVLNGIGPALGLFAAGWIDQQMGTRMIWVISFWIVLIGFFILLPVFRRKKEESISCQNM